MTKLLTFHTLLLFSSFSAFAFQSMPDSSFSGLYEEKYKQGHYDDAFFVCNKAIEFFSAKKDTFYSAKYSIKKADLYRSTRDFNSAINELDKLFPFADNLTDKSILGNLHALYGSIYFEMKNHPLAEEHEKKAIEIFTASNDRIHLAYSLNVLGSIYRNQKKTNLSLNIFNKSLELYKELVPEDVPNVLINISFVYSENLQFDKAINYLNESLAISRKNGTKIYVSLALNSLFLIYEKKGDFRNAFYFSRMYNRYVIDTLYDSRKDEMINSIRTQYETEKKETENKALKVEIENQRIITISTIIGLVLLSVIIVTLIILYRNKARTEKILLEQKRQIELYNENLVKINSEIKESENRLKNLNQVKDKWFSIISHDIRSPIGTLLSTLKYNEDFEPKEMNEILISIGSQVEATFNMIENLLQWSYSQLSGFQKLPSKFDIVHVITENILLLKPTADKKLLEFIFETSESIQVWADKNMINLVIRNLLSNAIKFSKENNKIVVSVKVDNSRVFVSVKDNGVGISEPDLATLFTPQEGKSKYGTSNEKGVGFGLVLCHDFVVSNGGDISVTSKTGVGTEFMFSIPSSEAAV